MADLQKEKFCLRRCWGFNRNFRRCGRRGDWKLFCEDHRRQPITALIFLVFTAAAGTASIQSAWFPHLWQKRHPAAVPTPDGLAEYTRKEKDLKSAKDTASAGEVKAALKVAVAPEQAAMPRKQKETPSMVQVNNAPNGIAIGGGIVTNPTVNNFGPPSRRLTADEKKNLKNAVSESKARVIIWFYSGDDTQGLAQDLFDVFAEVGWEMAAPHPEAAIQTEPQKCDIALFLPASSANEPASAAAIAVVTAMKSSWMHQSVGTGLSNNMPEGSVKLVVGPRWGR